jgi:hypothetical protein
MINIRVCYFASNQKIENVYIATFLRITADFDLMAYRIKKGPCMQMSIVLICEVGKIRQPFGLTRESGSWTVDVSLLTVAKHITLLRIG